MFSDEEIVSGRITDEILDEASKFCKQCRNDGQIHTSSIITTS